MYNERIWMFLTAESKSMSPLTWLLQLHITGFDFVCHTSNALFPAFVLVVLKSKYGFFCLHCWFRSSCFVKAISASYLLGMSFQILVSLWPWVRTNIEIVFRLDLIDALQDFLNWDHSLLQISLHEPEEFYCCLTYQSRFRYSDCLLITPEC